jgi:hypothetical protein
LCFEINSIVTASTTRQGTGIASDGEDNNDPRAGTLLEDLFHRMAESALSTRMLRLALLVRTFDDTMKLAADPTPYQLHRKRINQERGPFGHVFHGLEDTAATIRECSNKIIHAEDVRPTYETDDDKNDPNARWGMTGVLELQGVLRSHQWSIDINIHDYLEGILELIQFGDSAQEPPQR